MAWASLDLCSSSTPRSAVVGRLVLHVGTWLLLCLASPSLSAWCCAQSGPYLSIIGRFGEGRDGEYYQTGHVLALLIKLSNHCINKEIQSNISRNHHQNLSPPTPLLQNSTNIVKTSTHLRQLTTISFLYGRTDHPERLYRRPSHGAIFISGLIA